MTTDTEKESLRDAIFAALPPIFAKCVETHNWKYDLSVPRIVGDHVCATNGRIAVRLTASETVKDLIGKWEYTKPFPKVEEVFSREWEETSHVVDVLEDVEECGFCGGSGKTDTKECHDCDEGTATCDHCDSEYECRTCSGLGYLPDDSKKNPCFRCDGSGFDSSSRQKVGAFVIAHKYLSLLCGNGTQIFMPKDGKIETGVYFKMIDGVDGVVMPMRY